MPDRMILKNIKISIHYSLPHGKHGSFVTTEILISFDHSFCNIITKTC